MDWVENLPDDDYLTFRVQVTDDVATSYNGIAHMLHQDGKLALARKNLHQVLKLYGLSPERDPQSDLRDRSVTLCRAKTGWARVAGRESRRGASLLPTRT